jgi:AraC-like DNA-binding protein
VKRADSACVGAATLATVASVAMVAGGEARRLQQFLHTHRLTVPRPLHRLAPMSSEALDERVAERVLVGALAGAVRSALRPSLSVDFGSTIQPADMGIYGLVILTAPTLAEALERSVRFQRLMTTTAHICVDQHTHGARWIWRCTQQRTLGVRIRNEVVLAEHVAIVRALTPGAVPQRVSFAHAAPSDCAGHARFFACPILWEQAEDCVEWAAAVVHRPLATDPALAAFIEAEAQRRLALLPNGALPDEVKDLILHRLPTRDIHLTTIAGLMGRTPRSLRRELANAGSPYRGLVDGLRRQRARDLALQGQHSMTEMAQRLGYSELSAFSRAWRRWFGP